jgi:hypothetical protein
MNKIASPAKGGVAMTPKRVFQHPAKARFQILPPLKKGGGGISGQSLNLLSIFTQRQYWSNSDQYR